MVLRRHKIAFTQLSFNNFDAEIFVMNPDGSAQMDLSNDPGTSDFDPEWSPDGTQIAWARATETSDYDIWVMHADGTNQTQLTTDPGFDGYPVWSPDGTKIAFARATEGRADVYVMDADGSNETNLTNDPANDDYGPTWSPDGLKIAFARCRRDGVAGLSP